MDNQEPIFLVGAERSGTTLLRLMLDHHPEIIFHHEFEYAVDRISSDGKYPDLSEYYDYLSTHRIFAMSNFAIDSSLDYPSLIKSFLSQRQKHDNKPLIGATVHHHFDKLLLIWPRAKFIHIVRDGRDVARSNIIMGWAGNMFVGADRWVEAETIWKRLSAQLPPENQMTLYYERLIQEPEKILNQVCDFIGVPFDKVMFDYAKNSSYELPDTKIVERWRKMPQYELQQAECKIAQLLTEHGYPLSGYPILPISFWLATRLYWHSRLHTVLFRIRRYSFRLYLADLLSRRLHLKNWQRQVKLRINACDQQHLK